jgi:hypothetical protein
MQWLVTSGEWLETLVRECWASVAERDLPGTGNYGFGGEGRRWYYAILWDDIFGITKDGA